MELTDVLNTIFLGMIAWEIQKAVRHYMAITCDQLPFADPGSRFKVTHTDD